jgi:hypothetical protein
VICQSDGSWSSELPTCTKKRCFTFPDIENGYIVDKSREYFYGDQAKVECHRGYSRIGSNIINCGEDQKFMNLPKCEGNDLVFRFWKYKILEKFWKKYGIFVTQMQVIIIMQMMLQGTPNYAPKPA